MSLVEDVQKGIRDPYLVARKVNEQYHRHRGSAPYNPRGTGIFSLDWDNLILLDACRFDVFKERSNLVGSLSHRYTLGSRTPEFIRANFTDRQQYDLIYVSENGWYHKLKDDIDAAVFKSVLRSENPLPERHKRTTETALDMAEQYPHKRLLVHFIPPHHPYHGPLADQHLPAPEKQYDALFKRIRRGEMNISDTTLRDIYSQNLDRVLSHVSELLDSLPGKTVVSADHGEALGERAFPVPIKMYGHNPATYCECLTKVPWHVHDAGARKTARSDFPDEESDTDLSSGNLDEHLEHLGYKL